MMDVRDRAAAYLSLKPCSSEQMRRYLKRKGYGDEEIETTIAELEEYHYLDDLQYAVMYFEAGFEKGRGLMRIRNELRERGVSRHTIEDAEASLEEIPDEREAALQLALQIKGDTDTEEMDRRELERFRAKIARRLAGRGYPAQVVYDVIRRIT